jgi:hypothetical protein
MVRRKGEMTDAQIDRGWPHQVALAGELVKGRAYTVIHEFCRSENLSLCPRGHSFRGDDDWYVCFCFAEAEHAMRFQQRFGGELMDPAWRPRWPRAQAPRRDLSLEARLRNGRCVNCDD